MAELALDDDDQIIWFHPDDPPEKPMSALLANCTNLDDLTRDQVRAIAVEVGLPRGDFNREELIAALRENGMIA